MVMYIVPPYRPHRSLIGQPIIGVGSMSSFSAYSSPGSSPTSGGSNTSKRRRTRLSNTHYTVESSSANTYSSMNPPCPPAYNNKHLRRRDTFGMGEATMSTTRATRSQRAEMPLERIPAFVREERSSRYDKYNANYGDDYDYYADGGGRRYERDCGREYRYSRRNGENRLRSFSEHARVSGRRDLIDLMQYAFDEDDENSSWTRYYRSS